MAEELKNMFFTDKLRALVSMLFLGLILVTLVLTWAFPRHSENTLDAQTVETLKDVTEQFKRAADNLEQQSQTTATLNTTLSQTLALQQTERNDAYKQLLDRYGLDASDMDPKAVTRSRLPVGTSTNPTVINIGVQPATNSQRSDDLPASTGTSNRNRQLQKPAGDNEEKTDRSAPAVPGRQPVPSQ